MGEAIGQDEGDTLASFRQSGSPGDFSQATQRNTQW